MKFLAIAEVGRFSAIYEIRSSFGVHSPRSRWGYSVPPVSTWTTSRRSWLCAVRTVCVQQGKRGGAKVGYYREKLADLAVRGN